MMPEHLADSRAASLLNRDRKVESQSYEQLLIAPEYQRQIEKIARKHIRGTSISWEDAAQTAGIKVFWATQTGKFRQGGAKEFYHWAATVARCAIIDLVRKERQWNCTSLDQNIPGTDLPLSETISDEFDLLDSVERADLILKAVEAIAEIDRRYPNRGYLKLWQGRVEDKTQAQLAVELGLSQGAVSKRWQELIGRIAEALGLLQPEDIKRELQADRKPRAVRARSSTQW